MNISTSQKNNTHMHKYIKVYHFLLLMKWKGKKGLKRNKVKTENAKMKVIKWERIWDTKRERERETYDTYYNYKPSGQLQVSLRKTISHLVSLFRKNKIRHYFYRMSWTSYEFKWLGIFIFCFWMVFWLKILFICCWLA